MTTYTQFEEQFLVATYLLVEQTGQEIVRVGDVLAAYPFAPKPNWLMRALGSYQDHGWTKGKMHFGPAEDQHVFLNAHGVREAEKLFERGVQPPGEVNGGLPDGVSDISGGRMLAGPQGTMENIEGEPGDILFEYALDDVASTELVPASDRLVPLDHNSAPYREVKEGLAGLYEEFRSTNDLECSPSERERLLTSLSAAQKLWEAAQLKIIQIKVGIIITVEDVVALLSKAGKAVGGALLVDTIKSIVKQKTGFDL